MAGAAYQLAMCSVTAPDLHRTVAEWCGASDYRELAREPVTPQLAGLWGVDPTAHHEAVVTAAQGSERGFVRWIDTRHVANSAAQVESLGPFALEFFARDVDALHDRVAANAVFRPVAAPATYNLEAIGSGMCRSFAVRGPGDVWLFFTTVLAVPPPRERPVTPYLVSPVVNMPIAGADRAPLVELYAELLGIGIRFDGRVADAAVNAIMGAPADWSFHITVFSLADGQLCEQHIHPPGRLSSDATPPGVLRSGPAIETLLVSELNDIVARARAAGRTVRGPIELEPYPYEGRPVACIDGVNGEILELVQA